MTISPLSLTKLVEKSKLVSKKDLALAQVTSQHLGCSITDVLVGRGLLKDSDLGKLLSDYYRCKFVDLEKIHITQAVLNLIPENLATERRVIPFTKDKGQVSVAMLDPKDLELIEIVHKTIGSASKIIPYVATEKGIKEGLKLYKKIVSKETETEEINKPKTVSAVIKIEQLLEDAIKEEASDIHIEPLGNQALIRFRIDGVLHDQSFLPIEAHPSIVARIKVLSELKLDEHRHPQDGQFSFQSKSGEKISLRVSVIPTVYGEKVVLRTLGDTLTKFNLEDLGLLPEDQEMIGKVLNRTHGMFLVTGPTGSGKTTTLYTLLGLLNNPGVNIITIEDPVENRIRRVNQTQVNPLIDLTFAKGLRSILRQDPDIVMVGEIRDTETSVIAVNAAMTGHLVFSSVHANNAAGAIPRMIDLGVEPFLLASTLNMVVAQRLVRVLCPKCKKENPISEIIQKRLDDSGTRLSADIKRNLRINYQPKGCPACNHTGFHGRTGIFEIINVDDQVKNLIISKSASNVIWESVRKQGTKTMLEDGLIKVSQGITTIEEVLRVISE